MDDRYGLNLYGQYGYKGIKPDALAQLDYGHTFLFPPNWRDTVSRGIGWRTVVINTPYAIEQRGPQRDLPSRRLRYSTLLYESHLAELLEWCERMHATPLWWPMWPEGVRITETGLLFGLVALTPAESMVSRYDMMHLTRHIVLAHYSDRDVAQVLEVTTIAADLITLDGTVTIALGGEDARVYPAVSGYVDDYTVRDVTDAIATVDISLAEVRETRQEYQP